MVADVADSAVQISLGSNVFLSLFFKALLQKMWETLIGIQNTLIMFYVKQRFPSNADVFLQIAM
jgi:hypothetical protein